MNKLKQLVLVVAAASTLAVAAAGPALAAESSYKFSNALTSKAARLFAAIFNTATGHDHDGVNSKLIEEAAPATQTIASGQSVAADACGGFKLVRTESSITTSTSDTFASTATATKLPCVMWVVNAGTHTLTLDNNSKFMTAGDLNVVLGSTRSLTVIGLAGRGWTQGGYWTNY